MAQHDYVIANGTGAAVRSDLNNGLAAIVSNNSGATEPTTMYAYQWWADTTTGLLKQRNAANSAWVTVGTLASANLGLLSLAGGTMTGVLAVTAGTAALPGIAVSGDLNTGLVSPGADQLAITTGGTSRLAVSTTAVSSTLPVDVPLGAVGTPSLTFTGDLNTGIWSPAADTIAFSEGGAEAMRIDSSSRLLVGTSTNSGPNALVEVAVGGQNAAQFGRYTSSSTPVYVLLTKSRNDTKGVHTIVQNNDGMGALSFLGSDGTAFAEGARIEGAVDGTPGANVMPGRLVFSTNGGTANAAPTERMRIASTGNISVGSTNDQGYKIGVLSTSTAAPALLLRSTDGGDVGTAQLRLVKTSATSTTSQIFIQFVIDGNNTNSGQINANGASQAAFGSFSDVRLKENIENLPSQLNSIMALRPVEFDYKDGSGHQIGFIAQEMEQIYSDAIGVGADEMLTVTGWSKTEARLVKALQEAVAKIETLETRLSALEAA